MQLRSFLLCRLDGTDNCRNGSLTPTIPGMNTAISLIFMVFILQAKSHHTLIPNCSLPPPTHSVSEATWPQDGVWDGKSISGRVCSTATMPTKSSTTCCTCCQRTVKPDSTPTAAPTPTCSTLTHLSKLTATSDMPPVYARCSYRATTEPCISCLLFPTHGQRAR